MRVFMAVVGPSESGKTELVFKFLEGKTFYPRFKRAIFFYTESQPMFSEKGKSHNINIEFVKINGFDWLRNIENVLLVFDDSFEQIYNDNEFVKLATEGRHKDLDVIYVKHNLFQQSCWS